MFLCYVLTGCSGGGTSGSGIVVVRGIVKTSSGDPLTNATVELVETGNIATTDSDGMFSLNSTPEVPEITLNIKAEAIDVNVPVEPLPPKTDTVTVNVVVNPTSNTGQATVIDASSVQFFAIKAFFTPGCDAFFENTSKDTIRQTNRMKNGTECTLKVTVHGDGELQAGVTVGLERISCDQHADTVKIATAQTLPSPHEGVAQLNFNFYDSYNACEYRISAPYKDSLHRQQYIHIVTLTQQDLP